MKTTIILIFATLLSLNTGYPQVSQGLQSSPQFLQPSQNPQPSRQSSQNLQNISNYKNLSQQQLFDTANYYFSINNVDTALMWYGLILKTPTQNFKNDPEQQIRVITALNRTGVIYMNISDYRSAYKNLIDALRLCEKYKIATERSKIYNNLGNIYYHFKRYDIAKQYYYKGLNLCGDTSVVDGYYNNLGITFSEIGKIDSAFYFFSKSLQISKQYNNDRLSVIYNSIASLYRKIKQYDSGYCYYKLSLLESRKNNQLKYEVQNLSDMGELFLETKQIDSALYYITLSNRLAEKNNFLRIMATNYSVLSKVEELRGNTEKTLEYFKRYAYLQDTVFNTSIFGDINQFQRLYEIAQTDEQIEELFIKQQNRERIILVVLCILVFLAIVLFYIYRQNRKLNNSYKVLVEKNIEIINLEENLQKNSQKQVQQENSQDNNKRKNYVDNIQDELFNKIIAAMEDVGLICDPGFSVDKLASVVQSNHTYISQVIKNLADKNFRSFLNSYRIKEVQRIFSEPDVAKYTIESVALRVGYKSRSAFYDAFKEITGVSPNFYLKSMQKQREDR